MEQSDPELPIALIGAGFPGIGTSIRLKQAGIHSFTIFERAGEIGGTWRDNPEVMVRTAQAFVDYSKYVTEIIEDRRRCPQDDLLSILVKAKDEGLLVKKFTGERKLEGQPEEVQGVTDDELIVILVVLLVAGNETTRNAISGGMQLGRAWAGFGGTRTGCRQNDPASNRTSLTRPPPHQCGSTAQTFSFVSA